MNTVYKVKVSAKTLKGAADMLRYDNAYSVERQGDNLTISCLHFTPERWRSYAIGIEEMPVVVYQHKVSNALGEELRARAEGFTAGLRFAGYLLETPLVEGSI